MADGKVVIETDLDSSGIEKGISKLGSLTTKGLKTAATTITGTAVALEGIGIAAVKAGSDFEAQMSRVKAISGATGTEFEKLKDQAIQLGADTSFSASQAAEGMENLAAAGFTTNEIMEAWASGYGGSFRRRLGQQFLNCGIYIKRFWSGSRRSRACSGRAGGKCKSHERSSIRYRRSNEVRGASCQGSRY